MKYMLLIAGDWDAWNVVSKEDLEEINNEYWAYTQGIVESGEFVSGEPLEPPDTATTVRVRDGEVTTTDGPYAETKEVLGGFYVVDCKDLDRAIELAAKIPGAARGLDSIEVRPVMELGAPPAP